MPVLAPPVVPADVLHDRPQPVLTAGELTLRPWHDGDVADLVAAYADPDIQRWHVRSMTPAEAAAWVRERAGRWSAGTGGDWAVADRAATVVGRVSMGTLVLAEGRAEVGYWVRPPWRGRGIAGRALGGLARWLFDDLGLHRLELNHATDNLASCRVALRAGFAAEGVRRAHGWHADGWHDMHLHARIGPST